MWYPHYLNNEPIDVFLFLHTEMTICSGQTWLSKGSTEVAWMAEKSLQWWLPTSPLLVHHTLSDSKGDSAFSALEIVLMTVHACPACSA